MSNQVHFIRQNMANNRANFYFTLATHPVGEIAGEFLK